MLKLLLLLRRSVKRRRIVLRHLFWKDREESGVSSCLKSFKRFLLYALSTPLGRQQEWVVVEEPEYPVEYFRQPESMLYD